MVVICFSSGMCTGLRAMNLSSRKPMIPSLACFHPRPEEKGKGRRLSVYAHAVFAEANHPVLDRRERHTSSAQPTSGLPYIPIFEGVERGIYFTLNVPQPYTLPSSVIANVLDSPQTTEAKIAPSGNALDGMAKGVLSCGCGASPSSSGSELSSCSSLCRTASLPSPLR